MRKGFNVVLLAAGLAGCGATPQEYRNEKELPLRPGEGPFSDSFTHEWRKKDTIPAAAPVQASAREQDEFKKWRETASSPERREFEEWRAWQEWKRKNPK
jgi:hypothetical protein